MGTSIPHKIEGHSGAHLIGQAARLSGLSAANIRFYEQQGLIPARGSGDNQYRIYGDADVAQLRFIRRLRSLDMSLDEVRSLLKLDLRSKTDCQTARDTLDAHIVHVKTRLSELNQLAHELTQLRLRCDGSGEQCHLIEALHEQAQNANISQVLKKQTSHL